MTNLKFAAPVCPDSEPPTPWRRVGLPGPTSTPPAPGARAAMKAAVFFPAIEAAAF